MKHRILLILSVFTLLLAVSCQSPPNAVEIAKEYYNLANAYYKLAEASSGIDKATEAKNYYTKAVDYYKIALNFDPKLSAARFNLCYAYIKDKDFSAAEAQARQLSELNPENDEIANLLAYILSQTGEIDEAQSIYAQVLSRAPENITALNNSAILYWNQKEKDKAVEQFNRILEYDAEHEETYYNLGELYVSDGQYTMGIEKLRIYLEQTPEDYRGQLYLARGLRGIEEYASALEAYEQSLLLNEKQADVWFEKAEILLLKVLDPNNGATALEQALSMGFQNKDAIKKLIESQELLETKQVDDLLTKYKIDLSEAAASEDTEENSRENTEKNSGAEEATDNSLTTGD